MSWHEFTALLSNITSESQLARIIAVRTAEGDELKILSPEALKLRDVWYSWIDSQKSSTEKQEDGRQLQNMFKSMFYERGKVK